MQNIQSLQAGRFNTPKSAPSPTAALFAYITALSGLVVYYPMNETSGNAVNYAPATIGTLPGVNTGIVYNQAGQAGGSYQYNGSTAQTIVAAAPALNLAGTAITLGVLVNLTNATGNYRLTQKFGENYMFNLESSDSGSRKNRFFLKDNTDSTHSIETNVGVALTTWKWIIGTYDGTTMKQYVNATVQTATATSTFTLKGENGDLGIGASDGGGDKMVGYLQHYFLTSTALTGGQIASLVTASGL